ncbi:hypothetical protein M8C13_02440 [Crossiella sp. SN42]|uniref:hypothetical protein n=1 Tax=Crossiella sp. SN42 TaxID=2944808 RepID=UPI00207CF392|nr:hypothetical protein [Crossiella sp. SN42]MCO1574616.1 hypothetical protein [Crossiella sp. SN42]
MDPITLAVGGGLLIIGYLTGRLTRRKRPPEPVTAVCGCGHSLALHDVADGACHGENARPKSYNKKGDYVGTVYTRCPCRRYVGPQPLEDIITTRYLPPAP